MSTVKVLVMLVLIGQFHSVLRKKVCDCLEMIFIIRYMYEEAMF